MKNVFFTWACLWICTTGWLGACPPFSPFVAYCENNFPSGLEKVDEWWNTCRQDGLNTSTMERILIERPNQVESIRILDKLYNLLLQRGQEPNVYFVSSRLINKVPDTAVGVWVQGYVLWNTTEYAKGDFSEEDIRASLQTCPQTDAFNQILEAFPDSISGAIAIRLLSLKHLEDLNAWLINMERLVPAETMSRSMLQVIVARESFDRGDWATAAENYAACLERYPFKKELAQIKEELSNVYAAMGSLDIAEEIDNMEGTSLNSAMAAVFGLEKAKELWKEGRSEEALELLSKGTREEWEKQTLSEALEEMEALASEIRYASGSAEPFDESLAKLKASVGVDFLEQLSESLAKHGADKRFMAAVLSLCKQAIENRDCTRSEEMWAAIAECDETNELGRSEGYFAWISCIEGSIEDLLVLSSSDSLLENFSDKALRVQLTRKQNRLIDVLESAEIFVRGSTPTGPVLNLADLLYARYREMGIRNAPDELYRDMARRCSSRDDRLALAEHADKMGCSSESKEILRDMLSEQPSGEVSSKLLRKLVGEERYKEAAPLAVEIAKQADEDSPNAWYQAADVLYEAQEYQEALKIAEGHLEKEDISPSLRMQFEKVKALGLYRTGMKEEGLSQMKDLMDSGHLSEKDIQEYDGIRLSEAIDKGDYPEALELLPHWLEESNLSKHERNRWLSLKDKMEERVNKEQEKQD